MLETKYLKKFINNKNELFPFRHFRVHSIEYFAWSFVDDIAPISTGHVAIIFAASIFYSEDAS